MRNKIVKKFLRIYVLILLFSVSVISGIGMNNISDSELSNVFNIADQTLPIGDVYFILLSDYTDGAGDDNLWAVQLRFDFDQYVVESEFDNKTLALITDEWVELRVYIDLGFDWMEVYYNGELLVEKKWSAGPDNEGNGIVNLSAVDLFSSSSRSVYFDDFNLEEIGVGVKWSDNFDSYEDGSSIHRQGGWKGWDNNSDYTAYVSSERSRSPPHSLDIKSPSDLVRTYFGDYYGEFNYTVWIYYPENFPPTAPIISGPEGGAVGEYINYSFVTNDPNFDDLYYFIDWGDGDIDEWVGPYASGEEATIGHEWSEIGEYEIRAKARDDSLYESKWSEPFVVNISNAPEKPTIDGSISGKIGEIYTYFATSSDPDGDQIYYMFDWGDGSNTGWKGPFNSGETGEAKHAWTVQGTYSVKVKAKDVYGAESVWSEPLDVTIPRDKKTNKILVWKLIGQFQILHRLLYLFRVE
jgi:hypothetical protein